MYGLQLTLEEPILRNRNVQREAQVVLTHGDR